MSTITTAARIAALTSWANTSDRTARTKPARDGLDARFLREARERLGDGATDRQVTDAAGAARQAHFIRMAQARWHGKDRPSASASEVA